MRAIFVQRKYLDDISMTCGRTFFYFPAIRTPLNLRPPPCQG